MEELDRLGHDHGKASRWSTIQQNATRGS